MRRRAFPLGLAPVLAGLCVAAPGAVASMARALDLTELTAAADQIVVADVLSARAAWDGAHQSIHTTVELAVAESWKGQPPADGRITIRNLGGAVGDIEMTVHGAPRFSAGERALLFLRRSQVVGMAQGKRSLRWQATSRRWLVEPADRAGAFTFDEDGKPRPAEAGPAESLDGLRSRIRNLVGRP